MAIDWSKMTKEDYETILNSCESIKRGKSKLALMQIELDSYKELEEFNDVIENLNRLIKQYDEFDKKLEEFIL